ncbi:MAG: ribosome assembly cofactor RimP [Prevotellaceae bacterium]|nr:ribosome assembly cofactor RimP [Prevotellaceae bacterium]
MIDKQKVRELAEEWLAGKEYFLVDATVDADNKITVEIDHKDGVWIEDCCELSRFIEAHFDRDEEDFELEVGSAGIGQPFKVLQQYLNNVGNDVEVLTAEGRKLEGELLAADADGFVVAADEKQRVEGKKRPVWVSVEHRFGYADVKWVKAVIDFK